MPKKIFYAFVVIILLSSNSLASLKSSIDALIKQEKSKKVVYGVYIVKADNGDVIYAKNHKRAMLPASNMKLVTSSAALHYLGCDYTFETKVGLCGDNLVIIGSGDPLLGEEKLNTKYSRDRYWPITDIVKRLKNTGVKDINCIITDTSFFDDCRVHPSWPVNQLNQWYACEVSGLNFNDNCIDIKVSNRKGRAVYSLEPATKYLKIINKVKSVSKGKSAVGAYRSNKENTIYLKGKVHKSTRFKVAIQRPAGFFGYFLAEKLLSQGFSISGMLLEEPADKKCKFKLLTSYKTSISDVIERANRDSLSLAAESMLKTISAVQNSSCNGSWIDARALVGKYLASLSVSQDQFVIDDGSGLSRKNRLSPNAIVKVIRDVCRNRKTKELILKSLSVGGVRGTAKKWFREKKYKGKIYLKTGYINGVRSYSGICKTSSGDILFSIITNHSRPGSRKIMNSILKKIIDRYDKQGK